MNYTEIIKTLFERMSSDEFNEAQLVKDLQGNQYMEFDVIFEYTDITCQGCFD